MDLLEVAAELLRVFKGRTDRIGVQKGKAFESRPLTELTADKLAATHLKDQPLGFYLMQDDNTVQCACFDADDHGNNALAIDQGQKLAQLIDADHGLPFLCEISQSGQGVHIWFIFDAPIPAALVRKVMKGILRQARVNHEVYPKQDTLEGLQYGNLVRYPLCNLSRFVDWRNLETLDPISTLHSIKTITQSDLERISAWLTEEIGEEARDDYSEFDTNGLPRRVSDALDRGPGSVLAARWSGDVYGMQEKSISSIVFSLAVEMVRNCIPTPEIEAALRYWCEDNHYDKGLRPGWIRRTVVNAYNFRNRSRDQHTTVGLTLQGLTHRYLDAKLAGEDPLIPSGISQLDDCNSGGIAYGELGIVTGRPSHAKSSLALQWMLHAAFAGFPCLYVSLEMSEKSNGRRAIARLGVADQKRLTDTQTNNQLRGTVDDYFNRRATIHYQENCFHIDEIDRLIDRYAEDHGVKLVVLDYQGYVCWKKRNETEDQTEITKRLKQAAKRNDIAILSIVMQTRSADGKNDSVPTLSRLKNAGEIEQSADIVIGCRWPWMDNSEKFDKQLYLMYGLKNRDRGIMAPVMSVTFDCETQTIE